MKYYSKQRVMTEHDQPCTKPLYLLRVARRMANLMEAYAEGDVSYYVLDDGFFEYVTATMALNRSRYDVMHESMQDYVEPAVVLSNTEERFFFHVTGYETKRGYVSRKYARDLRLVMYILFGWMHHWGRMVETMDGMIAAYNAIMIKQQGIQEQQRQRGIHIVTGGYDPEEEAQIVLWYHMMHALDIAIRESNQEDPDIPWAWREFIIAELFAQYVTSHDVLWETYYMMHASIQRGEDLL